MQQPDNSQNFNRYSYCLNNPLKYKDPTGDLLTWIISNHGFSFGLNFGFFGFGVNIGGYDSPVLGVYGELGPRVGGTGFGAGATISQSLDYNFASKSFSTSTSFGVYGSLGLFNAGGNASYSYGKNGGWDWNVSAGVNLFGNDQHGVGLNIGYGSGGWTFGIGGYYDSHALDGYPIYNPEEWNNDEHILSMTNCYIYALNDKNMNDRGPVFGYFNEKGKFVTTKMSTEDVINSPQLSNRIKKPNFLNKLGFGKDKYYPIYLVVGGGYEQGELTRYDYHFYRKEG